MPSHSMTMIGAASATRRSIQGNPNHSAASTGGANTSADTTRRIRSRDFRGVRSAADAAIAPFASAELGDGLLEMILAEVGPQRVDEHQLGVGALPEQEVA